jgi:hypothetical protein
MPPRSSSERRRGAEPYDFSQFHGYRGPRFTPIPDEFLDHQLADLTSAEAKVMLFLFRKTYGYRKSGDRVSFAQLQRGTVAADGTIIDRGTGLSKATVWRALKGLQQKGLIEVYRQTTRAGDPDVNYYRIREYAESAGESGPATRDDGGGPPGSPPDPSPGRPTPEGAPKPRRRAKGGLFNPDTTPPSELNRPHSETKPPGSLTVKPTRTDFTRENLTLSSALSDLACGFLRAIGYNKPSRPKRERTIRILSTLMNDDGYSFHEVETACEIAVSLGARGPELIPHVIGQEVELGAEVGEKTAQMEQQEHERWRELTKRFESLPDSDRQKLLGTARGSNRILSKRPLDHPLVRAAAIALLDEG